jgi:hypothetical protein
MDKQTLSTLFNGKLIAIPDYQRADRRYRRAGDRHEHQVPLGYIRVKCGNFRIGFL